MNEQSGRIPFTSLVAAFPSGKHPVMRSNQRLAFEFYAKHKQSILEIPPGEGKTAIEYTILQAAAARRKTPLFLITPNKTILQQIHREYPDLTAVVGRNEHPCFYYEEDDEKIRLDMQADEATYRAHEIPCSLLRDCPHRVDLKTGMTYEEDAVPCPYLYATYKALKAPIVLCTMAYYLFAQLFTKRWDKPEVVVIDEAHRMAEVVRQCLSYEITDWHLRRAIDLLHRLEADEADLLEVFLKRFIRIVKRKPAYKPTLLQDGEVKELISLLEGIEPTRLANKLAKAIVDGDLDVKDEVQALKQVETLVRDIRRYIHSFEYSLEAEDHGRLNYTYAFYKDEKGENERVQHRLTIKSHYVAPLVRKILGHETVALSATIGDPEIFSFETGIEGEFLSLKSSFPAQHARIYMPLDTPNLAFKARKPGDVSKWLRVVAHTAADLGKKGIRSLVVVVSNEERDTFMLKALDEGLDALSYGNGVTAREAAQAFRDGHGTTLVGTEANYSEGIDLPRQTAPVIFVWRPGNPHPEDPATIFEEKRFGHRRWPLWHWRIAMRALQVRGRNIRSAEDIGVTIFVSQQFRKIVFASLPDALRDYYDGDKKFAEVIEDVKKVVG